MAMSYGVTLLDTNGVRGLLLSLLVATTMLVTSQPALASCAPETAQEVARRGDVAASGVVSSFVPLGFIFAADRVYKGDLPAHVLVLGQYQPTDAFGSRQFVVMRFHLPGVYSMGVCDGRTLPNPYLSDLGDARPPSADLPVLPVAVGLLLLLLLFVSRRNRGKPAAPATATAY
jgi:hypothetical protein